MRKIDFLPESYRETRRRHALRIRRIWLAGFVLAGLACWFGVEEVRLRAVRRQLAYLEQQHQISMAGLEHIATLQAEQALLLDRHRLVQELQSPVSTVETMFQIARLLPDNVALKQLQVNCQPMHQPARTGSEATVAATAAMAGAAGEKPTQAVPASMPRVTLTGLAASQVDIAVLVGQLSGCREFANVRLDYSKATDLAGRRAQEFRVTFDVTATPKAESGPADAVPQAHAATAGDLPAAGPAMSDQPTASIGGA